MKGVYTVTLLFLSLMSQAQFKFNNVDTVSQLNRDLISFFQEYIDYRAVGNSPDAYWYTEEKIQFEGLDVNEQWDYYYSFLKQSQPTILGLGKQKDNIFKIKIAVETGMDSASMILFSIQNFLVYNTPNGFKMGNMLAYNMENEQYVKFSSPYFDYYYPQGTKIDDVPIKEHNDLLEKLEKYFDTPMPHKFQYIHCETCEDLYRLRGIDYVANMMSTKTTVCGWTYTKNRLMYSAYPGFHKHEVLRLLSVLAPHAPLILADGITNLTGGAGGKPIKYHIAKLAPYLSLHPEKIDNIEDFWYYDDETNPYFVFHALITNYFLKTKGEVAFKDMMLSAQKETIDIRGFLQKYCDIDDVTAFFIDQLNHYAENELEFVDFF